MVTLTLCAGMMSTGCKALQTLAFASGGAAVGSVAGPGGAAIGAGVGVAGSELLACELEKDDPPPNIQDILPKSPWAEFLDSASKLLSTVGWWYLLIFILLPILTKKGRNWVKHLVDLGDTITKKDVGVYTDRLDSLEGKISSMIKDKEDEVSKQ